jgi:hypothetical protein
MHPAPELGHAKGFGFVHLYGFTFCLVPSDFVAHPQHVAQAAAWPNLKEWSVWLEAEH